MKNILGLLLGLLLTSCGVGFQYTTLNHAGHIGGIYSSRDYTVDILNEFQFRNKLRTDFQFRFDYAQYALSQPASFDWNNRILGNRYNRYNPYYGYSPYWNRDQMWNDWVWGYDWYSPHLWSPFNNNWGSYPYYGWNNYGWNNYGWNNWGIWNNQINPNWGRSYINGRRSNTRITPNHRVINNRRVVTTPRTRTVIKNKPGVIKNKPRINNPRPRPNPIPRQRVNTPIKTRSIQNTSTLSSNSTPTRSNSRRKN